MRSSNQSAAGAAVQCAAVSTKHRRTGGAPVGRYGGHFIILVELWSSLKKTLYKPQSRFGAQTARILRGLPPKRDCGSKRVDAVPARTAVPGS